MFIFDGPTVLLASTRFLHTVRVSHTFCLLTTDHVRGFCQDQKSKSFSTPSNLRSCSSGESFGGMGVRSHSSVVQAVTWTLKVYLVIVRSHRTKEVSIDGINDEFSVRWKCWQSSTRTGQCTSPFTLHAPNHCYLLGYPCYAKQSIALVPYEILPNCHAVYNYYSFLMIIDYHLASVTPNTKNMHYKSRMQITRYLKQHWCKTRNSQCDRTWSVKSCTSTLFSRVSPIFANLLLPSPSFTYSES